MLTTEQIERRRKGIGGSDAPSILGIHPTRGPLSVFMSKAMRVDDDLDDEERIRWGNLLEPVIREEAARRLELSVTAPKDTFVHRDHEWMLGNVDGLLSDGSILETKNIDWMQARDKLGEPGTDAADYSHIVQVQHYMEVLDRDHARVAYLVGGNDLRIYEVPRDRELGALLVDQLGRFWRENVLADVPPPMHLDSPSIVSEYLKLRYPRDNGEVLTAAGVVVDLLTELRSVKRAASQAKSREAVLSNEIRAVMGDASTLVCDFGKLTWKANKNGVRSLRATFNGEE